MSSGAKREDERMSDADERTACMAFLSRRV